MTMKNLILFLIATCHYYVLAQDFCLTGYIMDNFCIDRGFLLDTGDETLRYPERQTVRGLVDVPQCRASGYAILADPSPGQELYTVAAELDGYGNAMVIDLAQELGSCGTCDSGYHGVGAETAFRATVVGKIVDNTVIPPLIQVTDMHFDGCPGETVRPAASTTDVMRRRTQQSNGSCVEALSDPVGLTSNGVVVLRQSINLLTETVTMEVTYAGQGWVGIGFSENGRMIGTTAVIGLPGQPNGPTNPGKYYLGAQRVGAVQLVDNQDLQEASITQNGTHTVLRFTKPLSEPDGSVIFTDQPNTIIFAVGFNNKLAVHSFFGVVSLQLTTCNGISSGSTVNASTGNVSTGNPPSTGSGSTVNVVFIGTKTVKRSLWVAHGILMAIAWGFCFPIGIGFSLLRNVLGMAQNGSWFKYHIIFNSLGIVCTLTGFLIAIVAISYQTAGGENANHFSRVTHRTIGLVVVIVVLIQAMGGILRPKVTKTISQNDRKVNEEEMEDGTEKVANASTGTSRKLWEYGHRAMGLGCLGLALYNCNKGISLYQQRYGYDDNAYAIFWGITGSILCIVFIPGGIEFVRRYFAVK